MNLTHKLILLAILLPFLCVAQSNYKTGYVITNQGDTIKGFIDYRGWDANPTAFNFKKNLADKNKETFTVNDVKFFELDHLESYFKFSGKISTDPTNPDKVSNDRDTSFRVASVFLKMLQKGKNVALSSYTDDIKTRYFIAERPDFTPVELIYHVYNDADAKTSTNGKTFNQNIYLKQLFSLANKYNALDDNLNRTFEHAEYNADVLIKIVSKINNFSEADIKNNRSTKPEVRLSINAGVNINTISPNSASPYASAGGKSETAAGPSAGIGIRLLTNPNTGRVQLRATLTVAEASYSSTYQNKVSPYIGVKASFNDLRVALTPEIVYNFYNANNFKFYGGVGLALAFHSYSNAFFGPQNPADSFGGTAANSPYYFNGFDTPFLGTIGIQVQKHWEFFINYLSSTATTKGGYFQLSNSSENVGVSYVF